VSYDVVVIGEPLLEFSASSPLTVADSFSLSFSGDALNAAAAAAAAGAHVGLLTRLGRDELSDRLVAFLAGLGIDTALVHRVSGQTGAYVLGADPSGTREFAYLRAGSAATHLEPSDVDGIVTRAVLLSGITPALSPSCAATVLHAAAVVRSAGGTVVYDPNYRPRLTTPASAAEFFRLVAPHVSVAIPSSPADTSPLFGVTDPATAARQCHSSGVPVALITCGTDGVLLSTADGQQTFQVIPAPTIIDSTGAGDSFAGTLTARLALGDDLPLAVRLAMSAASLSLGGQGGTGLIPSLTQTRTHLTTHS
jgi:2-dehydro-3-deoxygluconokinase